jgi:hypothetical protein
MVVMSMQGEKMGEDPLERDLLERPIIATEVLAASLAMRLTLEELEWLWRDLAKRAEEKRREAAGGEIRTIPGMRTTSETFSFRY